MLTIAMAADLWVAAIGTVGLGAGKAEATAFNLMQNGSFEQTTSAVTGAWVGVAQPIPVNWSVWIPTGSGKEPNKTTTVKIDTQQAYEGNQSLLFDAFTTSRVSVNQAVTSVLPGKSYRLSMWMKTDGVAGQGAYFRTQFYNTAKVGDGPATAKLTGTRDWTRQQVVLTVPDSATKLTVEPFLETGTGKVWFDNLVLEEYSGLTGITLDRTAFSMEVGDTVALSPALTPSTATDKTLVWTSSNPQVADVDPNGRITGKETGTVTIRVSTADGTVSAECLVNVESSSDIQAYEELRQKWYARLTGGDYDVNDPDIAAAISTQAQKASALWDSMNLSSGRSYLWSNLASTTDSSQITTAYTQLKTLVLAYSVPGSELSGNRKLAVDIIGALDWMYTNRYNSSKSAYNNWWDWEIGSPQTLNDVIVLMYDELSQVQIDRYLSAIDKFSPNPKVGSVLGVSGVKMTGANLLDKAFVVTVRGIIGKNSAKILLGRDSIGSEYVYATKGDGIYKDGSLVQHNNIAYTGGYGSVWLKGTADLSYLLSGSPWPIVDPNVLNVYDWISQSFQPIIYNGQFMDMVNGRGISRSGSGSARSTIITLLRMAESAPEEVAVYIRRMAKEWIAKDTTYANYYTELALSDITIIKQLMNDDTIEPRSSLVKNQVFAGMDRVVHLRDSFGFGLSLFSDRISAFEKGNNENLKGWYTGIGMTYLYDSDSGLYRKDFWPTVDAFRLPGTTTDGSGQNQVPGEWASYMNTGSWVGGVSLEGEYGAAGMDFSLAKVTGSDLKGKKSWFMFDNEIVALGSGISSSGAGPGPVETIVENRMLNDAGDNLLLIDGIAKPEDNGWSETEAGVHWAYLNSNTPGTGTGYYFPDSPDVHALRELRTASWKEINATQPDTPLTRNYLSLALEHGDAPADASYSYVLLPEQSAEATQAYSDNPDIEVLVNTEDIHAVKERKLGLTALNFWNPGTVGNLRSANPASVVMKETEDSLIIAVSDPSQRQSEITLDLQRAGLSLVSLDNTVTVSKSAPFIQLKINTQGALGATHEIVFKKNAPVSSLLSPVQTETSVELTWSVPAGIQGIAGFEITKDGVSVSDAIYQTVSGSTYGASVEGLLPATVYLFSVTGLDANGRQVGPSQELAVTTRDDTPPSAPVLSYSSLTDIGIVLDWSPSTDNVGVMGYSLYQDGDWVQNVSASVYSQIIEGLLPSTKYVFSVKVADSVGHLAESNSLQVTTKATSGNNTGGGNSSGRGTDSGLTAPITPASGQEAASVVTIKSDTLKNASGDIVAICLRDNETKVVLPVGAGALLGNRLLDIMKDGTVSIRITPALLAEVQANTSDSAAIMLTLEPAGISEMADFAAASSRPGLQLRAGSMLKFGISTADSSGTKEYSVTLAEPFLVRFELDAASGLDRELLGVYTIDQAQGDWHYTGRTAVRGEDSHIVAVNLPGTYALLEYAKSYEDLPAVHWAFRSVQVLAGRHIVEGQSDVSFAPGAPVTRAEFVAMLARAVLPEAEGASAGFTDVSPEAWYAGAVIGAREAGIITGSSAGLFNPNGPLTREDMAVIAVRLAVRQGAQSAAGQNPPLTLSDTASVSPYALDGVMAALELGLMEGYGQKFQPQAQTTRAEAVQVLMNILQLLQL